MDSGARAKSAAVDMAGILEMGGARYKILDELAKTPRRPDYSDSVSTRQYSEERNEPVSGRRVEAIERTLSDLVHRIDDILVSRDADRRRPPLQ